MSGTYGIKRLADVQPQDVEILVQYTPNRNEASGEFIRLDSATVLQPINNPNNTTPNSFEIMGGLYNLTLPVSVFSQKGIYNIVIRPLEIRTKILDCGILSNFQDVKGLVFDINELPEELLTKFENGNLVGYRIEYLNDNLSATDRKINNFYTIITSNNRVEPVNENLTNTNQKSIKYRYNDISSLTFCTVTPNSAPLTKPNAVPFIGNPNQDVIITNTYFNPIMLEVELVDYDEETLAYALLGNQTKSLEDGIYTIYNFNNEIYKQYDLYEIKDRFTGKPLFEVREERTIIDPSKQFNNISI